MSDELNLVILGTCSAEGPRAHPARGGAGLVRLALPTLSLWSGLRDQAWGMLQELPYPPHVHVPKKPLSD